MAEDRWEEVDRITDPLLAEIVRGLLEAQGVMVWLAQEGAARALGLNLTPMGEVKIMVPSNQVAQALEILEQYNNGVLGNDPMDTEYPTNTED